MIREELVNENIGALNLGDLLNDVTSITNLVDDLRRKIQKAAFRDLEQHPQIQEVIGALEETKNLLENISRIPLNEDADDDRDFEIEEAIRDGEADGASGEERTPPHSFASRYYNDAYDQTDHQGRA